MYDEEFISSVSRILVGCAGLRGREVVEAGVHELSILPLMLMPSRREANVCRSDIRVELGASQSLAFAPWRP